MKLKISFILLFIFCQINIILAENVDAIEYKTIFKYDKDYRQDEKLNSIKFKFQSASKDKQTYITPMFVLSDNQKIRFFKKTNITESNRHYFSTTFLPSNKLLKKKFGNIHSIIPIEFYAVNDINSINTDNYIDERIEKLVFQNNTHIKNIDKEIYKPKIKGGKLEIEIPINEMIDNLEGHIVWNGNKFEIIKFEIFPCRSSSCTGDYFNNKKIYPLPFKLRAYLIKSDKFKTGCKNQNACNYDPTATFNDENQCHLGGLNKDGIDCLDECGGSAEEDECGVCEGDNSTCTDCEGNINPCNNGSTTCDDFLLLDNCNICNGPGFNEDGCCSDNKKDCAQVCDGSAEYDQCGECDSDTSNDCVADCNGDWGGTAKIDDACTKECCGGNTTIVCSSFIASTDTSPPLFTGDKNCKGTCKTTTSKVYNLNECGECVKDGSKPKNKCEPDCTNTKERCDGNWIDNKCWGGTAVLDECNICNGDGPKKHFDCDGNCIVDTDCLGECGGYAEEDECGVCNGAGYALDKFAKNDTCCPYSNAPDCFGECGGNALTDNCGECIVNGQSNKEEWNLSCAGCTDIYAKNYNSEADLLCEETMVEDGCIGCDYYKENIYFISTGNEMFIGKNNFPSTIRLSIFKKINKDTTNTNTYSIIQGADTSNVTLFMDFSNNTEFNKENFKSAMKQHGRQPKNSEKNQDFIELLEHLAENLNYPNRSPDLYLFITSESADFEYENMRIQNTTKLLEDLKYKLNHIYLFYIYQDNSDRYIKFDNLLENIINNDTIKYVDNTSINDIITYDNITILNCNINEGKLSLIKEYINRED